MLSTKKFNRNFAPYSCTPFSINKIAAYGDWVTHVSCGERDVGSVRIRYSKRSKEWEITISHHRMTSPKTLLESQRLIDDLRALNEVITCINQSLPTIRRRFHGVYLPLHEKRLEIKAQEASRRFEADPAFGEADTKALLELASKQTKEYELSADSFRDKIGLAEVTFYLWPRGAERRVKSNALDYRLEAIRIYGRVGEPDTARLQVRRGFNVARIDELRERLSESSCDSIMRLDRVSGPKSASGGRSNEEWRYLNGDPVPRKVLSERGFKLSL